MVNAMKLDNFLRAINWAIFFLAALSTVLFIILIISGFPSNIRSDAMLAPPILYLIAIIILKIRNRKKPRLYLGKK